MSSSEYILGIDTSNYKTSVAVIDSSRNPVCDFRRLLNVKEGERGLRQSDALFQHINNLPQLIEKMRQSFDGRFAAIAYSSRPRPVENSYMPVFKAGESFGRALASALRIPCVGFSHQEGHIEAVKTFSSFKEKDRFLACHFSGGTCELLRVTSAKTGHDKTRNDKSDYDKTGHDKAVYDIEIIGGSKDISFGQVIDRAGVAMGCSFPAGEVLDRMALTATGISKKLTPIKVNAAQLNLSGIDTQIKNILQSSDIYCKPEATAVTANADFVREIFAKLADAMTEMIFQGAENSAIKDVLMAGGVSSSLFIRNKITADLNERGITVEFNKNDLSSDNAVGTALLGGKYLWD